MLSVSGTGEMADVEFTLHRLSDYSDESLVAELRRVACMVPSGPLTRVVFDTHSRASSSTMIKRFGGWREALDRAGLSSRYSGQTVSHKMRQQPGRSVTREEVLAELRRVARVLGRDELMVADFNGQSSFSSATVRIYFPLWRQALEAAGLSARPTSVRYSDEECFENLLQVWTHFGRPPQYREMGSTPSSIGGKAYVGRWGTWVKALEAFVERVNQDDRQTNEVELLPELPVRIESATVEVVDDRRVKLGVRFKVLVRDKFKCVLCGNSPATDPSCKLHIDHVHPHSKGGLTVIENLRTLCDACNLGKGNLMIEETNDR